MPLQGGEEHEHEKIFCLNFIRLSSTLLDCKVFSSCWEKDTQLRTDNSRSRGGSRKEKPPVMIYTWMSCQNPMGLETRLGGGAGKWVQIGRGSHCEGNLAGQISLTSSSLLTLLPRWAASLHPRPFHHAANCTKTETSKTLARINLTFFKLRVLPTTQCQQSVFCYLSRC